MTKNTHKESLTIAERLEVLRALPVSSTTKDEMVRVRALRAALRFDKEDVAGFEGIDVAADGDALKWTTVAAALVPDLMRSAREFELDDEFYALLVKAVATPPSWNEVILGLHERLVLKQFSGASENGGVRRLDRVAADNSEAARPPASRLRQ